MKLSHSFSLLALAGFAGTTEAQSKNDIALANASISVGGAIGTTPKNINDIITRNNLPELGGMREESPGERLDKATWKQFFDGKRVKTKVYFSNADLPPIAGAQAGSLYIGKTGPESIKSLPLIGEKGRFGIGVEYGFK